MRLLFLVLVTMLSVLPSQLYAQKSPLQCILPSAFELSNNPEIIALLNEENKRVKTPQYINEMEEKWKDPSAENKVIADILNRETSVFLKEYVEENPYYNEIYVIDFQGALTAASNATTDYFQGDEAPYLYIRQYGNAAFFVGNVEGDISSQSFGQKIALPILENRLAIGVIVLVVNSWYNEYFNACDAQKEH
ncbi:MAG: hypothetical protein VYC19_09940 [Pseudomonadota bacterium]|nr:hypothetical protein [Pseudomonadota bacterium]MEE3323414.1 hypothetical protein [Pseudomonadota bacterium]